MSVFDLDRATFHANEGVWVSCNVAPTITLEGQNPIIFFSHQWQSWSHPDPDNMQFDEIVAATEQLCRENGFEEDGVYLFLDYLSIPQKNMRLRLCAIDALGVISSVAHYFIVIAPSSTHYDTKKVCNKASYSRRGWCRLEQWGHLSTMGMANMFFYNSNGSGLEALDAKGIDCDWFLDSIMVFAGDYTNPENLTEMVDVVLGLYAME